MGGHSERSRVGSELHHINFNAWPVDALEYMIELAKARPDLNHPLTIALSRVDSPLVLTFFVEQEQGGGNGYSSQFLLDHWSDHWGKHRHYLSGESLRCVRELWQDESLSERARRFAFHYWRTHPDGDDATLLSGVTSSEPFYWSALQTRIQRGDISVVPEVLSLLENDSFLWHQVSRIWCPAIKEATHALAASISPSTTGHSDNLPNNVYDLVRVLRDIASDDAEEVLVANWDRLGQISIFLPLALWVGTPRCLELVKQDIDLFPSTVQVFSHLQFTLPIWASEGEEEQARPQVMRFLQNVLPYWARIDGPAKSLDPRPSQPSPQTGETPNPSPEELMVIMDTMDSNDLIEACLRLKELDWGRQHLSPLITERQRRQFFPTDEDLEEQLDQILNRERAFDLARHAHGAIYNYFSQDERYGIAVGRLLRVFLIWLERQSDMKRFQLAIAAVHEHGSRDHYQKVEETLSVAPLDQAEKDKLRASLENARFVVMRRNLGERA